jgi:hypothetical protein
LIAQPGSYHEYAELMCEESKGDLDVIYLRWVRWSACFVSCNQGEGSESYRVV